MTQAPIGVTFNDPDEFLAELRLDRERVDRGVLRVTVRRQYGGPFVTAAVVATAMVGGVLVRLDHRVGDAFAGHKAASGLSTQPGIRRMFHAPHPPHRLPAF